MKARLFGLIFPFSLAIGSVAGVATGATTRSTTAPTTLSADPTGMPAERRLDQIDSLLADGNRDEAIQRFSGLPDFTGDFPDLARRSADLRGRINQAADELLADVDHLIADKQYLAAADRLRALLTTMSGLPTASLSRQRLSELVSRPEIQEQIRLRSRSEQADATLAAARKLRNEGLEDQAYAAFQSTAEDFAGTPAGDAAADAVKAYEADVSFVRRQKDHAAASKARAALNLAENYRGAGRIEQAKKKYHEVIDQFPGTTFAQTARKELEAMK